MYISASWKELLSPYLMSKKWKNLNSYLGKEFREKNIYPQQKYVFNIFNKTSFDSLSVVIIGQDPYHGHGQAHGLSFSVPGGITLPPSLKNIYKEIESDLEIKKDFSNGNLEPWAEQGVFLLNSILTVEENKPSSHANIGWEEFTNFVIRQISDQKEHVIFFLWGNYAQKKGSLIDKSRHLVLETSHPSPLGAYRGFIGCRHFSRANEYLKKHNKSEINW